MFRRIFFLAISYNFFIQIIIRDPFDLNTILLLMKKASRFALIRLTLFIPYTAKNKNQLTPLYLFVVSIAKTETTTTTTTKKQPNSSEHARGRSRTLTHSHANFAALAAPLSLFLRSLECITALASLLGGLGGKFENQLQAHTHTYSQKARQRTHSSKQQ